MIQLILVTGGEQARRSDAHHRPAQLARVQHRESHRSPHPRSDSFPHDHRVDVDPNLRSQVIKQMNKLINVLQATDFTESPSVAREMALLRVRATMETRTAILKESEIFGARVVDSSVEGFAIEATGAPEKLDEFIDVMRSYGEIEVTRSGLIAVSLEAKRLRLSPPIPTATTTAGASPPAPARARQRLRPGLRVPAMPAPRPRRKRSEQRTSQTETE